MKVIAYSVATAAVALSVSGLSIPALYKRAVLQTKGLACATQTLATGSITPECEEMAGIEIGAIQGVRVDKMVIDFTVSSDPNVMSISSPRLMGDVLSVPGVIWPITHCAQRVTMEDNGIPIATFDTPSSPGSMEGNTFVSVVQDTPLKIMPGKQDNFVAFMETLLTQKEHTYVIHGGLDAMVQLNLPLGVGQKILKTPRIAFRSPVTLKGFDNFPKVDFVKQIGSTFDPATGTYTMTAIINVHNPSQFELNLGDISFQVLDQKGVVVGIVSTKDMKLHMGDNLITGVVSNTGPMSQELLDTLTTTGGTFTFQGYDGTSSNPILARSLKKFKAPVVIPKLIRPA
ncbi:hypothetical protein B0O80DRAFT_24614 [Mortierella sp. GBAus27b]|nr:hypothetical protein BGX31_011527 [Mortierella sp. GBA43]KAI8356333.1 hypothetical protein B0O80DRAFT_24614 [Mortierella sp. GBAus27b]